MSTLNVVAKTTQQLSDFCETLKLEDQKPVWKLKQTDGLKAVFVSPDVLPDLEMIHNCAKQTGHDLRYTFDTSAMKTLTSSNSEYTVGYQCLTCGFIDARKSTMLDHLYGEIQN